MGILKEVMYAVVLMDGQTIYVKQVQFVRFY